MVVLHILMPYLVRKLLDWLERKVQAQEEHVMPVQTRDFLLRCIPAARTAVLYVHRLHMAVFYMNGIYYHIAKNVTGVKYVSEFLLCVSCPSAKNFRRYFFYFLSDQAQILLDHFNVLDELWCQISTGFDNR